MRHNIFGALGAISAAALVAACGGGGGTITPGQTVSIISAPAAEISVNGGQALHFEATAATAKARLKSMAWRVEGLSATAPSWTMTDPGCAQAAKTETPGVGDLSSSTWSCRTSTFAPALDRAESYRLTVTGIDNNDNSATHTSIVRVAALPAETLIAIKPLAATAAAVTVRSGDDAGLTCFGTPGQGSTSVSYAWKLLSNPRGLPWNLTDADKATVRFVAPSVLAGEPAQATFRCTVTDTAGSTASSDVVLTISRDGSSQPAPSAQAAGSLFLTAGVDSLLSCYGSGGYVADPEVGLRYQWVIRSNPAGIVFDLSGENTANAKVRPSSTTSVSALGTTAVFQCRVTDDAMRTSTVDVPVVVVPSSGASAGSVLANAGDSRVVSVGAQVILDAGASTVAGLPAGSAPPTLFYRWSQVSGPTVSLSSANSAKASFVAPSVSTRTTLRFQVQVSTQATASVFPTGNEVSYVDITISGSAPPRISLPSVFSFASGAAASVSVAVQNNPEFRPLYIRWTQISGPTVRLQTPNQLNVSFFAPTVTAAAEIVLRVEVSFEPTFVSGSTGTADVYVRVTP